MSFNMPRQWKRDWKGHPRSWLCYPQSDTHEFCSQAITTSTQGHNLIVNMSGKWGENIQIFGEFLELFYPIVPFFTYSAYIQTGTEQNSAVPPTSKYKTEQLMIRTIESQTQCLMHIPELFYRYSNCHQRTWRKLLPLEQYWIFG